MSISATMVRDLREKTSAGMMDCKKALEETKGDFDAAVEWLRKKGLASASKKSDRLASEGLVVSFNNGKTGVLLEVNSETDFVAKNDFFKAFVAEVAQHLATTAQLPVDATALLEQTWKGGQKVGEALKEAIAKIGENLVIRRFTRFDSAGVLSSYIHGDGKIGVMVELTTAKTDEAAKTFASDVCLHIAAMNPLALSSDQVPADIVAKEKEIMKAKNLEQGKKPEMIEKIVEGQIRKFLSESCLLEQAFVKNPDLKVKDYMAETGKKIGEAFAIKRYVRFELGEGLQKKVNNFAEEVAAQSKTH
ncbi:MAG: elongation factor Ts [Oligoflexia bacterium]|nr:MAG: elongation factor Ts [Oligoflexia bacterium]